LKGRAFQPRRNLKIKALKGRGFSRAATGTNENLGFSPCGQSIMLLELVPNSFQMVGHHTRFIADSTGCPEFTGSTQTCGSNTSSWYLVSFVVN
jgi:hypothetical protein